MKSRGSAVGYGPTEFMAPGLFPGRAMSEVWVAQFHGYFDASGAAGTPTVLVAGAVAAVDCWAQFEAGWAALLEKHDVREKKHKRRMLHMRDFVSGRHSDRQRAAFYRDALKLAEEHTEAWFAHGVRKEDHNVIARGHKTEGGPYPAYAMCALKLCADVGAWWTERSPKPGDRFGFLFEDGDKDKPRFVELYYRELDRPPPLDFVEKEWAGCQLADMLAWGDNRVIASNDRDDHPRPAEKCLAWHIHRSDLPYKRTRSVPPNS